jgi:hypothetical protein
MPLFKLQSRSPGNHHWFNSVRFPQTIFNSSEEYIQFIKTYCEDYPGTYRSNQYNLYRVMCYDPITKWFPTGHEAKLCDLINIKKFEIET